MTESIRGTKDLALVHFEGTNAARFLQGYLTCNTIALPADSWTPGAFCDLKGRVVANGWVRPVDNGIDCVVHASIGSRLLDFLKIYLRFGKTRAVIDDARRFDVEFDEEFDPAAIDRATITSARLRAVRPSGNDADSSTPDTRLIDALNRRLFVLVHAGSSAQFLPQALGLVDAGAVAFDKGCYLGQEIVARAEHRGNVKRHLVRVLADQQIPGDIPVVLTNENRQKIGDVVQTGAHDALVIVGGEIASGTACYLGETRVTAAAE